MGKARIKLVGRDPEELNSVSNEIVEIAKSAGVNVSGPIPLPTKKLLVATRKSPCGDGTDTYEKWHMKIHKRIVEVAGDERTLRQIMRVKVPDTVRIEIAIS